MTKGMILLVLLGIVLLSSPLISAQESLGTIKKDTPINLIQTCSGSTYSNITRIVYPNKTITDTQWVMTKSNDNYNYLFTDTRNIGDYYVYGICDESGVYTQWQYSFYVTPSGQTITLPQVLIYILFLIGCLIVTFFSIQLSNKNTFEQDKINFSALYQDKKKSEGSYYLKLLKRKLWVIGVFGVYLSVLIFVAILNQLVYSLNLNDLYSFLSTLTLIMLWGLIPFCLFWVVYIIMFFYKSLAETMRYQFGNIGGGE